MPIDTKNIDKKSVIDDTKRAKVIALQNHHADIFAKERKTNPKFLPRLCYMYNGKLVFGLYPREILGGVDIYIEFCNRDYVPKDKARTLWKWIYNPKYATDYPKGEPHVVTKDCMYLIPVEELYNMTRFFNPSAPQADPLIYDLDITPPKEEPIKTETVDHIDKTEIVISDDDIAGSDLPFEAATIRDFAAIVWRKPISHKKFVNQLILNTFK